jgi:Sec-independent protein translocase protein TatA
MDFRGRVIGETIGNKKGGRMPASETTTIFQKLAAATGLSPGEVEIGLVVLFALLIVVIIYVVLAISRIRKEIISLNFAIRYLVRLLKQEIEGAATDRKKVSEKTEEKAPIEETKKEVDSDKEWKL